MAQLSPMDEIQYFEPPAFKTVSVTNLTAGKVASYNPQRVGLILSSPSANAVVVGPDNTVSSTKGVQISGSIVPIMILQKDWGVLVQGEWWAIGVTGTVNVTVIELLLNKWPTSTDPVNEELQLPAL